MYRHSLIFWSSAGYVALMLVGLLFEPILVLWPHFFLLATQEFTASPDGELEVIVAMLLGIVPVLFTAWIRQRRHEDADFETFNYAWSGFWTTVFTLAGLTAAAFLVAKLLGWHVGV